MSRKYLTGSRTQITEWPDNAEFKSMVNAVIDLATNQKIMVMGLSIQDFNLQTVFSNAKQVHPWPWPCAPHAPGHVLCGEDITKGQANVLKIVYSTVYDTAAADIKAASHMRAWAEQVLLALVLRVLGEIVPAHAGAPHFAALGCVDTFGNRIDKRYSRFRR